MFSGGRVGVAVGPADGEDELHRHVAGDAGDCRRSFADGAVLAELVSRELAGVGIVANLIRADDEGPAVLVPNDQVLGSGASWHGTDTTRKDLTHGCETAGITAATADCSLLSGLLLLGRGVGEKLRHG